MCNVPSLVPGQRCVWFPMGQHPDYRVPHRGLGSHVEVGVVSKLESQHISGVIEQNVLPCVTGFGKISTRNMSHLRIWLQCERTMRVTKIQYALS